jgi:hypothetical protein
MGPARAPHSRGWGSRLESPSDSVENPLGPRQTIAARQRAVSRSRALEKDVERDLGRATAAPEIDRKVEVDVDSLSQPSCVAPVVSGPLQLGATPVDDALYLWVSRECCFCRSHVSLYFVPNRPVVSPHDGGFHTPDLTHDGQNV